MDSMIWIVLVVLVLLVILGVVVSRSRKQREASQRAEAEQLRARAAEHDRDLREHEAAAAAADAQARRARAEADERAAHAQRLQVEAERRDEERGQAQLVRDEELRRADAIDPDVPTDKRGYRLDDDEELADPYGGRGETRHSDPREDHPDRHNTRIVGAPLDGDHRLNGDRPHDELPPVDRDDDNREHQRDAREHSVDAGRAHHSADGRAHHDTHDAAQAPHHGPEIDEQSAARPATESAAERRMDGSVLDKSHLDAPDAARSQAADRADAADRAHERADEDSGERSQGQEGRPTSERAEGPGHPQQGDAIEGAAHDDDAAHLSAADRDHRRRTDAPDADPA